MITEIFYLFAEFLPLLIVVVRFLRARFFFCLEFIVFIRCRVLDFVIGARDLRGDIIGNNRRFFLDVVHDIGALRHHAVEYDRAFFLHIAGKVLRLAAYVDMLAVCGGQRNFAAEAKRRDCCGDHAPRRHNRAYHADIDRNVDDRCIALLHRNLGNVPLSDEILDLRYGLRRESVRLRARLYINGFLDGDNRVNDAAVRGFKRFFRFLVGYAGSVLDQFDFFQCDFHLNTSLINLAHIAKILRF